MRTLRRASSCKECAEQCGYSGDAAWVLCYYRKYFVKATGRCDQAVLIRRASSGRMFTRGGEHG